MTYNGRTWIAYCLDVAPGARRGGSVVVTILAVAEAADSIMDCPEGLLPRAQQRYLKRQMP
jgi:hypothetical protein